MNLTDQQKKLLSQIVINHQSTGKPFNFVCDRFGCGLSYTTTVRHWAEGDFTDLSRLRKMDLVDFDRVGKDVYRGKPTQLGIDTVHKEFAGSEGAAAVTGSEPERVQIDINKAGNPLSSSEGQAQAPSSILVLDTERINVWISEEGYKNRELAEKLHCSQRVVSSIRNNGKSHGRDVVIKLANLMRVSEEELYRP